MIKSLGMSNVVAYFLRYFLMVGIHSSGYIFEYIDVASEVISLDPGGNLSCCFSFFITSNEFLM